MFRLCSLFDWSGSGQAQKLCDSRFTRVQCLLHAQSSVLPATHIVLILAKGASSAHCVPTHSLFFVNQQRFWQSACSANPASRKLGSSVWIAIMGFIVLQRSPRLELARTVQPRKLQYSRYELGNCIRNKYWYLLKNTVCKKTLVLGQNFQGSRENLKFPPFSRALP